MKKFKLILGLILLGFIGLFFYQNKVFFMEKQVLHIKLPFLDMYQFPEMPNAILFLSCLLIGFLISYVFTLFERFKSNKTIRSLNATVDSNLETISALKNELSAFKGSTPAVQSDAGETPKDAEEKL